jgi:hypothetical protein
MDIKHFTLSFFAVFILHFTSFAFISITDSLAIKTDTLPKVDTLSKHAFTPEIGYGSNSVFFGRSGPERLPFFSAGLTYSFNSSLWFSINNNTILSNTQGINFQDLSVGYSKELSSRITGSLSFTHSMFKEESLLLQSASTNIADAFVGVDFGYIYTSVGFMTVFGATNDYFLVLSNSRYFAIDSVFSKKDVVSIEPSFGIIAGTQNFASAYSENILDAYYQTNPTPLGPGKPGGGKPGGTTTTTTKSASDFNVLAYEFNLPLTYTINNFAVELNWKYIIPSNVLEGDPSRNLSVWTASMYYTLRAKKMAKKK